MLTYALIILVGIAAGYSYKRGFNEGIFETTKRTVDLMEREGLIKTEGDRIIPIKELLDEGR